MRKIFYSLVAAVILISCNNGSKTETQNENEMEVKESKPDVNLEIKTKTQQSFFFYNAGAFVAEENEPTDASVLKIDASIKFNGKTLEVTSGDTTEAFQVEDFEYNEGNVFKDAGKQKIYTIIAREVRNGELEKRTSIITIVMAEDEGRSKTIIKIPQIDVYGDIFGLDIYTD